MATNSYRLIVCFDIDADSLIEAYGKLVTGLDGCDMSWETADEWYTDEVEENEGEAGDVDVLISTITQYYDDNPKVDG
jgi:hypothetical protein